MRLKLLLGVVACLLMAAGNVVITQSGGGGDLTVAASATNTDASTKCNATEYLEGDNSCDDLITEAELGSEANLETQLGGINVIVATEIDSVGELLAITDYETGTGALVFGTSPTLTTPTISTSIALPNDAVNDIGEIAAAIKTDDADSKLVTTSAANPGSNECLEMDSSGSVVLAGGTCASLGGNWTLDDPNNNVNLNDPNDDVNIGALISPQGKLTIVGNMDEIQLLVRADDAQDAGAIFVVENSAGTDLCTINNTGDLDLAGFINADGITQTTGSNLDIYMSSEGNVDLKPDADNNSTQYVRVFGGADPNVPVLTIDETGQLGIGAPDEPNAVIFLGSDGDAAFNKQSNTAGNFVVSGDTVATLLATDADNNEVYIGGDMNAQLSVVGQRATTQFAVRADNLQGATSSVVEYQDSSTLPLWKLRKDGMVIVQAGPIKVSTDTNGDGQVHLYDDTGNFYAILEPGTLSAERTVTFPDATGTVVVSNFPAEEAIAAAATITADACGAIKLISTDDLGAVTTNTVNTFTAPAAGNKGCIMHVCNSGGTDNITLDNNANFKSAGGADVVMTPDDCLTVGSTGASGVWYQLTALLAN